MTLHDLARLHRYWTISPPLTGLVRAIAGALGVEIKKPDKPQYMTADEAMRLLSQTGGRIDGVGSM